VRSGQDINGIDLYEPKHLDQGVERSRRRQETLRRQRNAASLLSSQAHNGHAVSLSSQLNLKSRKKVNYGQHTTKGADLTMPLKSLPQGLHF
jgi:hypothetical protein